MLCLQFHWISIRILRASFVGTFFRKHKCIKALDFRWRPSTSVSKIKVSFLTFTVTLLWMGLVESNTLSTRLLLTGWERQSTIQDDHKSGHSEYFGTIGLSSLCSTNTDKSIPSLRIIVLQFYFSNRLYRINGTKGKEHFAEIERLEHCNLQIE